MRRLLRRPWLVIATCVSGLLVSGALGIFILYPYVGAWVVRDKVLPRLAGRVDRKITAATIDVGRGKAVLEDVIISGPADDRDAPLTRVKRVVIEFDFWATLTGDVHVYRATIEGAEARLVRYIDGNDNISDVLARLGLRADRSEPDASASRASSLGSLRPDMLVIENAAVMVRDHAAGIELVAGDIDATLPDQGRVDMTLANLAARTTFGPSARVERVAMSADMHELLESAEVMLAGGKLSLHDAVSLSNIGGQVRSAGKSGRLAIDLRGSYGGAMEELWQARGWVEPFSGKASIHVGADRFTFDRLDSILRDSAVVDYQNTAIGAAMDIEVAAGVMSFAGTFELTDGNVYHPMIAEKPVRDIDVKGAVQGTFDSTTRTLQLTQGDIEARGVSYRINGLFELPGGMDPDAGQRRAYPHLGMRLIIPRLPCQTMLEGLPEALRTYLNGFELGGRFHTDLTIDIDWADLEAAVLEGSVGIFGCTVRREPQGEYGMERLLGSFTHYVEAERDQWLEFLIGPENPDFVPLWDVSPHLLNSLMTTEDSRFYEHRGFIAREFRTALIKNLQAGYFRYGASSITMQTVKNVLLYREKTLARKLQELFLTWHIENRLDKDRIFEIYVNAIEYGPGLYGIGPAARHYFGKHPRDLNPAESAFFSSILPGPKQRYKQYCDNRLWTWTEKKIQRILGTMHKRGRLTDEEYAQAMQSRLEFDRTEAPPPRECKLLVQRAIKNARPTNPMKK